MKKEAPSHRGGKASRAKKPATVVPARVDPCPYAVETKTGTVLGRFADYPRAIEFALNILGDMSWTSRKALTAIVLSPAGESGKTRRTRITVSFDEEGGG